MVHILRLILTQMVLSLRSRAELQAENLALRHQIEILKRTAPKRARLTKTDRLIFTWLLRLWPKSAQLVRIVHPKTLVRWHREGFRVYWRWKSRPRGGRPKARSEVRVLIRQMGAQNPLWGAPRIHGELLKLGFDISQATVSRYMPRRPLDPDHRWATFLRNHLTLHGFHRFPCRPHFDLQDPLRARRPEPRSTESGPLRCHPEPNGRVDSSANYRSLPLGRGSQVPHS